MLITVNYREIQFDGSTLNELLDLYRFDHAKIQVEINGRPVAKENYDATTLYEGDEVEIGRG